MRTSFLTLLFLLLVVGMGSLVSVPDIDVLTSQGTSARTTSPSQNSAIREFEWYPVVKVVDGDTIVVDIAGANTTVRLIGLDTPETVDPRKTVQCFGAEASAKMRQILSGQYVRLETDPSQGEKDKYGRLLAYVYAPANVRPEGILLNIYMIEEGFGHEYTYNIPYKYQAEFKAAENIARQEKRGLWADGVCASQASSAPTSPMRISGQYGCSRNTYNCSDFTTQAQAQAAFDACGEGDVHKLDSDGDKRVCESLP
ncbi:MAG: micrococcal nuclease, partial [Parcubacteria group bacterium Athens0416_74]